MDKFTEAEEKGRRIFQALLEKNEDINNINFTEDRFTVFDVEYNSGETKHFITELKYRDKYSSNNKLIQSEGAVLEKKKYDNLLNYALINGYEVYYVMLFNDGVGYSFNLKKIKPIFKEKYLPKSTCGNQTFIKKIVAMIPLQYGNKFNY